MSRSLCLAVLIAFLGNIPVSAQFSAQQIIDKAILNAGGVEYNTNTSVRFTFRGNSYRSYRHKGNYQLERITFKGAKQVHDVLSNKGLYRSINNCQITVADSLITKISDNVNSVHYFANLPYGLNAPAVRKELEGETSIKGMPYYKIKVTFDQEGGGTDFNDVFMYWVHKEHFTVDYMAYKYAVNGGGIRFRKAYNPRIINGIRFVDYDNYKIDDLSTSLSELDVKFHTGELKLVSKIELDDIYVYTGKNLN